MSGYCDCRTPRQRREKVDLERTHLVGCVHDDVFACQSYCVLSKGHVLAVTKAGPAPISIQRLAARLLGREQAARVLDSSQAANLTLHGRMMRMHAAGGDVTLQRVEKELAQPARYRFSRLASPNPHNTRVVVDIGCNLGDFAIAAWQRNPTLHILCLEPMPVTYLHLRWNLEANAVPTLTASRFGAIGQPGGVLPLQAAVTSDGRPVDIEYSPTLSGFGVTAASWSQGVIGQNIIRRLRSSNGRGFQLFKRGTREDAPLHSFVRSTARSLNLSAWLDARGISRLHFLKMDCEGCEYEVLPSITPLLRRTLSFEGELHR